MALASVRRATIKLPLFTASYGFGPINGFHGLGSFVTFASNSTDAYRPVADAISYPQTITRLGSELISVGGLSRAEVNPTSPAPDTGTPSIIDYQRVSFQAGQTVGTDVFTSWFLKAQNPSPGAYPAPPLRTFQTHGIRRSQLTAGPIMYQGFPAIGGLWTDLGFSLNALVLTDSGGWIDVPGSFAGVNTSILAANQGQHCRIASGSIFPLGQTVWDNSIFFPSHSIAHPSKSIFLFSSLDLSKGIYVDNLGFDDPSLDTPFQADSYSLLTTNFGFMASIHTGGTGPNGTPQEIVLIRPDWSSYALLQLVPQDDKATAAIAGAALQNWQAMVDSLGIFWFNPGSNAEVANLYTSYSPNPPIPTLYFPPLPPFVLPCEDFCPPLT